MESNTIQKINEIADETIMRNQEIIQRLENKNKNLEVIEDN
jgi:hypothetical protein